MTRTIILTLAAVLAFTTGSFAEQILVVCPPSFRPALKKWADHRREQGTKIAWLENEGTADEIRSEIRSAAGRTGAKYLMLVGDAPAANGDSSSSLTVPVHLVPAKVNVHWGPEREIATDNPYGDLDDDGVPDLAVGRLTADSTDELETITRKIIAYERSRDFGPWRRRINFVACPGNFGGVIDSVIEQGSRRLTTEGIPASFATTATYGHWRSPYCPDPRKFLDITKDRLNEGALFWVYIGHGHCRTVDRLHAPDKRRYPILRAEDVGTLDCASGHPIAMFLACYTGMIDNPQDSISEEMLRTPGAPVAIIAATRVTMPYAMTVMGAEMMREYFIDEAETVGDLFRETKRALIQSDRSKGAAKALDTLALTLNPLSPDLLAERTEHVTMFQLFGDPLMRLPRPGSVELESIAPIAAGEEFEVRGECSIAGECTIELVPRRDQLPIAPPKRVKFAGEPTFRELQETYEKANAVVLASATLPLETGPFTAKLRVPESASGKHHVRIFVKGKTGYAVGSADVEVRAASGDRKSP